MKLQRRLTRGFSLLVAIIIVLVMTLLVVGAIAYTGSERRAAIARTRAERISGCVQAARNLFLTQVKVLQTAAPNAQLDAGVMLNGSLMTIQGRHYSGTTITNIRNLAEDSVGGSSEIVADESNMAGRPPLRAGFYSVTATCQEFAGGPEQEVEFAMRIGL